ncbi:MAG: rod shape-determining protein MreD, partial [Chloroflexi bacterium]
MMRLLGFAAFLAAALLQVTWAPGLAIWGAYPNLVLLMMVVITWRNGARAGMFWACWGGVLLDLTGPGPIGPHALALLAGAYVSGFWTRNVDNRGQHCSVLADPHRLRRHSRPACAASRSRVPADLRCVDLQRRPYAAAAVGAWARGPAAKAAGVIERGRWLVLGGSSARQRWSFQLVALGLLAVVSLSVLAVKLAELQVSEGSSLAALARLNSVHRVVLEAERGIIYDRHGVALVQNAPAWNLEVIPAALALTTPARIAELTELARLSGIPEDELVVSIQNADSYGSLRLGPNLTEAQQLAINERLPGLPGVTIRRHAVRTYMSSMVLGHVIGYVGPIDEVEIKSLRKLGYQPDELVGKVGVEAGLESRLRGVDGWADVVVDARGQVVRTLATHSPIPGSSVYLSLDLKLELATAAALAAGLRR